MRDFDISVPTVITFKGVEAKNEEKAREEIFKLMSKVDDKIEEVILSFLYKKIKWRNSSDIRIDWDPTEIEADWPEEDEL